MPPEPVVLDGFASSREASSGKYQPLAIAKPKKPPTAKPNGPRGRTRRRSRIKVMTAVMTRLGTCARTTSNPFKSIACKPVHSRTQKKAATADISNVVGAAADPTHQTSKK